MYKLTFGVLLLATYSVVGNEGWRPKQKSNGPCQSDQYRCINDKCLKRHWLCDGANDCGDNSDEIFCRLHKDRYGNNPCPRGWLSHCGNGDKCIPEAWVCDRVKDCNDGSDEAHCLFSNATGVAGAKQKLWRWFLSRRQSNKTRKWGREVHRSAISYYLADEKFFSPENRTGEEITSELSLQLLSRLAGKAELSPNELALHINALVVSCLNPRDFYGWDLVSLLREQVDRRNYTNPFLSLTLCHTDDSMTQKDVTKIVEAFEAKYRPKWTDIQAFAVLALSCITWKKTNLEVDENIVKGMTNRLKLLQNRNGTIENLKTTALVLQALLASGYEEGDGFDLTEAGKLVVSSQESSGSYGNFLTSYYLLPVFNSRSLVNISSDHCMKQEDEKKFLFNQDVATHHVRLSLWLGDEQDTAWTLKLRVPVNSTLYSIWETAAKVDSRYRAKYNVINGKPYVHAILNMQDDAEAETFWYSFYLENVNDDKPKLIKSSPVDVFPKQNQEYIMWYRSGKWNDFTAVNDEENIVETSTLV